MPLRPDELSLLLEALAALPADWHSAGFIPMPGVEALARHASARRLTRSIETGAGRSTVLLSHLSERHTVFALDGGDSLKRTREHPLLNPHTVEFIEGPSQRTIFEFAGRDPLQLVLLDGPHGFPFPNLEYWRFYPSLEPGGLLVVDDIHIPTIRLLFDFLAEDPMFHLLEVVGRTAFFERTGAPTFDPFGDGWLLQPFNSARFPTEAPLTAGPAPPDFTYRNRLPVLAAAWCAAGTRIAIFGIGPHTDHLFAVVPELEQVEIVAFLDSTAGGTGLRYRGRPVERPAWAPGHVDLVLCSSFRHEWAQIEILDRLPVKAVFSHQPGI